MLQDYGGKNFIEKNRATGNNATINSSFQENWIHITSS